jgi:hypothetical protein
MNSEMGGTCRTHVIYMINAYNILLSNKNGTDHLGVLGIRGRIILK